MPANETVESFLNKTVSNLPMSASENDPSTSPLTALQIFSIIFFTLTSSASLLAYLLVLFIIIVYFKEFKSNFYYVVASLAIADMGFICLVLFYLVPCTVTQSNIWPSAPYVPSFIESITYFSCCTHLTYIGFNRLIYSCATGSNNPQLDKIFNSRIAVAIWISLCWTVSVLTPIMVRTSGCLTTYDFVHMAFDFTCDDEKTTWFTDIALLCDNVLGGVYPCLITVTQISAWTVIYCRGKRTGTVTQGSTEIEKQQRKRERRLLIQFTLISATLIFYYVSFWAIPAVSTNSDILVLITYSSIASVAVNPFTYLVFNKVMRAKARYLIWEVCLRRKNAGVHVGPSQNLTTSQAFVRTIAVGPRSRIQ